MVFRQADALTLQKLTASRKIDTMRKAGPGAVGNPAPGLCSKRAFVTIQNPSASMPFLLVLEERGVLNEGMNRLVDDVPIRGRAGVDLRSLDRTVLNPDDGLRRDR
jgi:hypothetical protein